METFFFFFFWDHLILGGKNLWISDLGRKTVSISVKIFFFLENTWFWAEKTFEFRISAEKSLLTPISVKTVFFFFFGEHLIFGEKNLWISELSEKFRFNFRTNRLKLIQVQWKFESRSLPHFSFFQNSPPLFSKSWLRACPLPPPFVSWGESSSTKPDLIWVKTFFFWSSPDFGPKTGLNLSEECFLLVFIILKFPAPPFENPLCTKGCCVLCVADVESSRTSLASRTSSRTHFEVLGLEGQVLGLGLDASSPRKLACLRLEDSSIFWIVKILWSAWKFFGKRFFVEIAWKIFVKTFFFWRALALESLVLGLEHSCPWPRECLSSERLSLALA